MIATTSGAPDRTVRARAAHRWRVVLVAATAFAFLLGGCGTTFRGSPPTVAATTELGGMDQGDVVADPVLHRIYVEADGQVVVLDDRTLRILRTLDIAASTMAIDPTLQVVYVANGDGIFAVDERTEAVASISDDRFGGELVVDPLAHTLYVLRASSLRGPTTISVMSEGTDVVTKTLTLGTQSQMAIDPELHTLYVSDDVNGSRIVTVDTRTNAISGSFGASRSPGMVLSDPQTHDLFVFAQESGRLSVLDERSGATLHQFDFGCEPTGLAVDPTTDAIWITDLGTCANPADSSHLALINGSTWLASRLNLGFEEAGVAVDPVADRAYVDYIPKVGPASLAAVAPPRQQ